MRLMLILPDNIPQSLSPRSRPTSKEQHITKADDPPPTATNWDDISPITGLSKEYTTAINIIDSCDYTELRRFNAPRLADQNISIGQQIEMYYNGGESAEYRRRREEKAEGKRNSVVEKIAAITAIWKGSRSRRKQQGADESLKGHL